MTLLSTENLSKNYGLKVLFEGLTFGLSQGDKTALIAQNGTGKSTLLKILAGKESPDSGEVMIQNGIRIGYLEQEPELDGSVSIQEFITRSNSDAVEVIKNYEKAVKAQAENFNEETQEAFMKATAAMDAAGAWDYEQRMEQILGKLDIHYLDQPISQLSGGERKRVALAFALIENPDLLILDEPTNHLDVDMIEWLESYLIHAKTTLLMVTHDRYFLDRVCNHILELEGGNLYHHNGNYAYFLEKRSEREVVEQTEMAKAGQLLKKELEWMRRSPKARTTKSKSRIQAFHKTKEKATAKKADEELKLEASMSRIGGRVLELKNVSKTFDELVILANFSYSFNKGERIGIIGKNGVGKSTFLKIITGAEPADSGEIDTGETIIYGHYMQRGIKFDENMRVIDSIKEIASVIKLADGSSISASQFLEHFMFTSEMQYTPIAKLSGGEKRRLGLMKVLMKNPNFLILDEPTNDLDLITLNKLEDFLMNFGGCLILVSHDRFFMDKLVDHYFIFEGDGVIRDHHGTYEEYRDKLAEEEKEKKKKQKKTSRPADATKKSSLPGKQKKLSFAEKKEYKKLEKDISRLEEQKKELEALIGAGELEYGELTEKSKLYGELENELEEKTLRWFEMAERAG